MSRIGKAIIEVPAGVTITEKDGLVTVKGPKGELTQQLSEGITLKQEDGTLTLDRPSESKQHKALHGLYRALINNMVQGTATGWTKQLELVGVGYRASHSGQKLELALGFSHGIVLDLPKEVGVETLSEKGKNPIITLTSYDKQLLGMVAAKIRSFRKPEPYKGKGIRFVGEIVRRKAGKSA
ncbi:MULTISPECIES: 50S ribosomal protein L6 [Chryseobacterium]|uniref:50S ribosomal protein L6 n=1 Tax=Chryseobacterium sp. R2A-55 TaxID=2744445 RepID=UPI001F42CE90|nr:50S ribosomal protein L6 [Chryseobacterium sp. R2A-55]